MRKAITYLKRSDQRLAALIEQLGPYRIQYREPDFETLARSIVYQQLSGKAAGTIFARLESAAGGGSLTPAGVRRLSTEQLRSLGLSQQKAKYVRDLACGVAEGRLDFSSLTALSDQEVIASLTQIKGVGEWTAQMFLIFALRRPDILPLADLGIRRAIQRLYSLPDPPTPLEIQRIGGPWRPYCSVASWYLWRSVDGEAAL